MVADLAREKLSNVGYETKILPPTLVLGKDVLISALDLERLVVPLETSYGPVRLDLSLTTTPPFLDLPSS